MCILESTEHVMRRRIIKYVRVLWTNQFEREGTLRLEEEMSKKYSKLFEDGELRRLCFIYLFMVSTIEAAEFEDEFF
jgi:hypothetical protein